MATTPKTDFKKTIKEWSLAGLAFTIILITHSLAYEDEIYQRDINCESAAFVADNNLICGVEK